MSPSIEESFNDPCRTLLNQNLSGGKGFIGFTRDSELIDISRQYKAASVMEFLTPEAHDKQQVILANHLSNVKIVRGYFPVKNPTSWVGGAAIRFLRSRGIRLDTAWLDGDSPWHTTQRYITEGLTDMDQLYPFNQRLRLAISALGGAGSRGKVSDMPSINELPDSGAFERQVVKLMKEYLGYDLVDSIFHAKTQTGRNRQLTMLLSICDFKRS